MDRKERSLGHPPSALFAFWAKREWRVERTLEDRRRGERWAFRGVASFAPGEARWVYEERGRLVGPRGANSASRRYLYQARGSDVDVYFEDGRFFHSLSAEQFPDFSFDHRCGRDLYRGALRINTRDWVLGWTVTGPQKDLRISTTYF